MSDMRLLGWAQGLLLGLVLASPMVAPALLPWGIQALFLLSAFQLRLADRRWALRSGWQGWISHIRMAPARMLPWAAAAVVALIAGPGQAATPTGILIAALASEILLYPPLSHLLGLCARRQALALMAIATIIAALCPVGIIQNIACFALGVTSCTFWLRGPDGDLRSALATLACTGLTIGLALAWPPILPIAFPITLASLVIALAQASTVRRHLLPWHQRPTAIHRWTRLRSRPS